MGDYLLTREPSQYITNTKVNSAFNPFKLGKSINCPYGWG